MSIPRCIILAAIGTVLSGCVMVTPVPQPGTWMHATNDADRTAADTAECDREGEKYANEVGNPYAIHERAFECMKARGYTRSNTKK